MFDNGTGEEKEGSDAVTSSMMNTVIMVWNKRERERETERGKRKALSDTRQPNKLLTFFLFFISASR